MGGLFQPTTTQTSTASIPPEIAPYAGQASQFLTGRLGEAGPAWPGPWTAPLSPQEQYGLGGLEEQYANAYASGLQPLSLGTYGQFLTGGVPQAAQRQGLETLGGAYLPGANPYLAQIEQGMGNQFQDALAEAQNRLALAGHGRSSTAGATLGARAIEDYMSNIGRLRFGAYESERARQAGAALPFSEMGLNAAQYGSQYPVSLAQTLLQAGALPRTLSQQDIDRAYQEMLRLWNETYRASGQLPGGVGQASTTYGPSPFMSVLSGALPFFLPRPP